MNAESDSNTTNVADMIVQARADREAFGKLLELYRPFLFLLAQRKLGSKLAVRCDAADVVQQTFVHASRGFASFNGTTEPEFSAWIKAIHRNTLSEVIRTHVKSHKRRLTDEVPLDGSDDTASISWHWEPAAQQSTPSVRLIRAERALQLATILESLPQGQRDAVRLRYLEGWNVAKIAEELGRSVSATAGLIKRGTTALRQALDGAVSI